MNPSSRHLITTALASAAMAVCGLVQAQSSATGTSSDSYGNSGSVTPSSSQSGYGNSSNVGTGTSGGMSSTMSGDTSAGTQGTSTGSSLEPTAAGSTSSSATGSDASPMGYEPTSAGYSSGGNSYSWLPYTTRGYVGINVGQGELEDLPCATGYDCDDTSDRAFKVYTGGMFNEYFGLELAYVNTGSIDRSGGDVKAHGLNVSLTAQAPLGDMAAVFAKIGGTYGWTETSAGALADVATGDESGAGGAYGVGVRVNFTPNWGVVLEWERHQFHFAGDRKEDVTMTTLGVQYRF